LASSWQENLLFVDQQLILTRKPLQHSWISQPLEDNAILATEVID